MDSSGSEMESSQATSSPASDAVDEVNKEQADNDVFGTPLLPTTSNMICSAVSTPLVDSLLALSSSQPMKINSWRGKLIFPCVEDNNRFVYNTDIFRYTDKAFRGREIRFPTTLYPANEEGWENLRRDLIQRARHQGYLMTSRGRDMVRNRIRLVCQQYRLYKCGSNKLNAETLSSGSSVKCQAEMDDDQANQVNCQPAASKQPHKRPARPKSIDAKCRVQLSIFYKHWGDPKGYFFIKGGTGEAVHSHHARLETTNSHQHAVGTPNDVSHISESLQRATQAKSPPCAANTGVLEELQSPFNMVSSALLQFPQLLEFAKYSLLELASTIIERGSQASHPFDGRDQEILSVLSAMTEGGRPRKKN